MEPDHQHESDHGHDRLGDEEAMPEADHQQGSDSSPDRLGDEAAMVGADPRQGSDRSQDRPCDKEATAGENRQGGGDRSMLHRIAEALTDWGKILAAVLVAILVVLLVPNLFVGFRPGIVRVKPFEVARSLEEAGFTGPAMAERFREKLTDIETTVEKWRARGARAKAHTPIRGGEPLGEVKVPGTDLSLDGLTDLILTAFRHPPVLVTGRVASTPAGMIAMIKVADGPFQISQVPMRRCDGACVDALAAQMAEAFYLERIPCSLELYYYLTRPNGSECERAARRCAQEDPVFAHNIWGIFEMDRGNLHAAVDHLHQARDLAENEGGRRQMLEAIIDSNWGDALWLLQDCPGAIKKYDAAIPADPMATRPYNNKGWALASMKKTSEAAKWYDKAIQVADPDSRLPETYGNWALLLYHEGKFNEAVEKLKEARAAFPNNTTILYHLAYALRNAGKTDEALDTYERVIDLGPRELDAYREAARLLRRCHRLRAAHEELRRALAFVDADGKAQLGCELADLEQQLRQEPETFSSQVVSCDSPAPGSGQLFLDQRQSWTAAARCYDPTSCLQLVADPRQPGAAYCMAKPSLDSVVSSLNVTNDGGATWSPTPDSSGGQIAGATVRRIALDASHAALLVLRRNGVISTSFDHGATWRLVRAPSFSFFQVLDVALTTGKPEALYTLLSGKVPCSKRRFNTATCARYRLFTSRNRGRSWLPQGGWLLPDPTGDEPAGQLWVDPSAASTVYAAVNSGAGTSSLWKSLDGGKTWRRLDVGSPVLIAAFDPATPRTLYIAVAGDCRQVLKSTDGGRSWRAANGGDLPHGTDVTALAHDARTLYAGTADGGVYAMSDGAATWQEVARGLPGQQVLSLATDGHGTLYAAVDGHGVYTLALNRP